jgi:hypothetical protein
MNIRIKNPCLPSLVLAAGLFAAIFPAAGSPLPILTINESNSTIVTITGTGNDAVQTDGTTLANAGVDLMNFFTAAVAAGPTPVSGSSLEPVSGGIVYEFWGSDTYQGAALQNLNLFSSSAVSQAFVIGTPAFSGTVTVDLSSFITELPALGASGFIYSGNSGAPGTVQQPIGVWQVTAVPEPAAIAQLVLGAMAFAGLTIIRRICRMAPRR